MSKSFSRFFRSQALKSTLFPLAAFAVGLQVWSALRDTDEPRLGEDLYRIYDHGFADGPNHQTGVHVFNPSPYDTVTFTLTALNANGMTDPLLVGEDQNATDIVEKTLPPFASTVVHTSRSGEGAAAGSMSMAIPEGLNLAVWTREKILDPNDGAVTGQTTTRFSNYYDAARELVFPLVKVRTTEGSDAQQTIIGLRNINPQAVTVQLEAYYAGTTTLASSSQFDIFPLYTSSFPITQFLTLDDGEYTVYTTATERITGWSSIHQETAMAKFASHTVNFTIEDLSSVGHHLSFLHPGATSQSETKLAFAALSAARPNSGLVLTVNSAEPGVTTGHDIEEAASVAAILADTEVATVGDSAMAVRSSFHPTNFEPRSVAMTEGSDILDAHGHSDFQLTRSALPVDSELDYEGAWSESSLVLNNVWNTPMRLALAALDRDGTAMDVTFLELEPGLNRFPLSSLVEPGITTAFLLEPVGHGARYTADLLLYKNGDGAGDRIMDRVSAVQVQGNRNIAAYATIVSLWGDRDRMDYCTNSEQTDVLHILHYVDSGYRCQ